MSEVKTVTPITNVKNNVVFSMNLYMFTTISKQQATLCTWLIPCVFNNFSLQLKVLLVCLGDLVSHCMMLSEEQLWITCTASVRAWLIN